MGDFSSLRIGMSALQAQRRAMAVTSHNIANVNTEGYTRQRVRMVAKTGAAVGTAFSGAVTGGLGVDVSGTERIRDRFLDNRSRVEHATNGNLSQTQNALTAIEKAFGEPGDTALSNQLNDFLASWDDVANNPSDLAARGQVVELGKAVANGINQTDSALAALSKSTYEELTATMSEVNSMAKDLAYLNSQISKAITSGSDPNDLIDKRDLLVNQLADRVGVTVREQPLGSVDVYVGGIALVRHDVSNALNVQPTPTGAQVTWSTGTPAELSGSTGGMLGAINDIIPRYRTQLADVASTLSTDVNNLHTTGFDLDGNAGVPFFVISAGGGVSVNSAIASDPRKVAASSSATAGRDGSMAQQIAVLSGPTDTYRAMILKLGVESQSVNRQVDVQSSIVDQVDQARDGASGVNLDDEMADMVQVQHAYEAAARVISAADEMLDTLINRTGMVGR